MAETDRMLTADDIWAAQDITEVTVPVPQWGGSVRIKTFTKRQADDMRKAATVYNARTRADEVNNDKLEALLLVEGMVEPKLSLKQYDQMLEKSAVAVAAILQAIMKASGMSEAAVADADKSAG